MSTKDFLAFGTLTNITSMILASSVSCERRFSIQNHVKIKNAVMSVDAHAENTMLITMEDLKLENAD